jgi:hypothetical protein
MSVSKAALSAVAAGAIALSAPAQVTVTPHEAERRIDVTIDGHAFTSYLWPTSLEKPVLYPLIAPDGTTVTRGFPLEPRAGERVDHPHHAGVWFNYGNVNGFDFWNNSGAIPAAQKPKMGSIHHTRIVAMKSGKTEGEIVTESIWTDGAGTDQLKEQTRYVFRSESGMRTIDRVATLTALQPITFHDDKEGLLGIRVAHFLESPTEKGGVFNDASGRPTKVDQADTAGATGVYRTSAGVTGDKVWSTRGAWCSLTGTSPEGKTQTIVILDHPANPGYPTYWHARGYGLFAANPLGDHIFNPKAPEHNFTIARGQTATFRYRILVASSALTPQQVDAVEAAFARVR